MVSVSVMKYLKGLNKGGMPLESLMSWHAD